MTEHLLITGQAGTGKTTTALRIAFQRTNSTKKSVVIVRNVVQTMPLGFLPGDLKEKTDPFFEAYGPIIKNLKRMKVKTHVRVNFVTTSMLRGLTFDDCVLIVDETQNLGMSEFTTVLTRLGKTSSMIVVGDGDQQDIHNPDWVKIEERFKSLKSVRHLHLTENHRSPLLDEWLKQGRKK